MADLANFARGKRQPRGGQTLFSFVRALDLCVLTLRKQGLTPSQFFVPLGGASWLTAVCDRREPYWLADLIAAWAAASLAMGTR